MAPRTHEQWVADQTRPMPAVVTADLSGKTLVLIGANTGLGFEAAKHFARMNPARLVLTARDEVKGKKALARTFIPIVRYMVRLMRSLQRSKPTLDTQRRSYGSLISPNLAASLRSLIRLSVNWKDWTSS